MHSCKLSTSHIRPIGFIFDVYSYELNLVDVACNHVSTSTRSGGFETFQYVQISNARQLRGWPNLSRASGKDEKVS
jgi:hypothetical protein